MSALLENTLFGVRDKVAIAIERMREFEPPEGYYLAYSGGKDSDVILNLARSGGIKFDAHHSLTTIDPPELVYHVRKQRDVVIDHPPKPFLVRLIEKGFPQRHRRWCCEEYKERGGHGRFVLTGIRSAESSQRARRAMVETCFRDISKRYLHPIIDWTDADVWEYLRGNSIEYCSLYDEGWKRIGCLFCPMASSQRKLHAARYPRYERAFIRAFERLHALGRESSKRWGSGGEMFRWWMDENCKGIDKDQLMMFENGDD